MPKGTELNRKKIYSNQKKDAKEKTQMDRVFHKSKIKDICDDLKDVMRECEEQLEGITDALGNTVYAQYNAAGQLIREIDPLGEKREYTYSPLGRLTGITDEAGRKINYTYEPGGQLIRKEFPDGTRETYTYDGNGCLLLL